MNKVCHLPVQLSSVPCSFFILLCVLGLTLAKRHLPGSLANWLPVILGQWEELVRDQRVGARVLLPLPTLIFCCHPGQYLSHPVVPGPGDRPSLCVPAPVVSPRLTVAPVPLPDPGSWSLESLLVPRILRLPAATCP